jgi:hypothetical protein
VRVLLTITLFKQVLDFLSASYFGFLLVGRVAVRFKIYHLGLSVVDAAALQPIDASIASVASTTRHVGSVLTYPYNTQNEAQMPFRIQTRKVRS